MIGNRALPKNFFALKKFSNLAVDQGIVEAHLGNAIFRIRMLLIGSFSFFWRVGVTNG